MSGFSDYLSNGSDSDIPLTTQTDTGGGDWFSTFSDMFGGSSSSDGSSSQGQLPSNVVANGGTIASTALLGFDVTPYLEEVGIDVNGFLASTLGGFMSDGFSCWGSTFLPTETRLQLDTVHAPYMQGLYNTVTSASNTSELESALNDLELYTANANKFFWDERTIGANWEQCSRKALDIYTEYYREQYPYITTLLDGFRENFTITETEVNSITTIPVTYDMQSGPHGQPYTHKIYSVTPLYMSTSLITDIIPQNIKQRFGFGLLIVPVFVFILLRNMYINKKQKKKLFHNLIRLK